MAHENKVLRSVEDANAVYCVDIFQRPDGSFGYQHCRRDPEDGRGWALLGHEQSLVFESEAEAFEAASAQFSWL